MESKTVLFSWLMYLSFQRIPLIPNTKEIVRDLGVAKKHEGLSPDEPDLLVQECERDCQDGSTWGSSWWIQYLDQYHHRLGDDAYYVAGTQPMPVSWRKGKSSVSTFTKMHRVWFFRHHQFTIHDQELAVDEMSHMFAGILVRLWNGDIPIGEQDAVAAEMDGDLGQKADFPGSTPTSRRPVLTLIRDTPIHGSG